MKARFLSYFCMIILFICSFYAGGRAQTPPAYVQTFDDYFNTHLSSYNGNVLVQVGCRGRIIYTYQRGIYSTTQNLDVQSISKLVTSAVIMTLVEENKFSLDDKAGLYIPSWNANGKQDVTIRQLLAHTSGLPANTSYDDRSDINLAQAVDLMAVNTPLAFTPGSQFSYGSCSYKVASRVAEIVENKPWKTIFAERMANVSGMPNAVFSQQFPFSVDNPLTGQGLEVSVNEYGNFLKMILNYGVYNGFRVMDSASVEAMQLKSSEDGGPIVTYGLGQWREEVVNGVAKEFHHPSASGCLLFYNRNKDYYGVILSQAGFSAVNTINQTFRENVRNTLPQNECAGTSTPGCDFNVTASVSPSSVNTGGAANLSYSTCTGANCSGVTYAWSGNGVSGSSSPLPITAPGTAGSYTYTVTASKSGCSNKTSNAVLAVTASGGGSYDQCKESELSTGDGAITSDPNASNGETRGEQNNYNHYVEYSFPNVPSAGTYTAKLRYYSNGAATVGVIVNGGSSQTWNLPNSGSWNIVWTEQTISVNLQAGTNTIRITGTGGGSCRQDKLCVTGTGGGCTTPPAPTLSASPSTITTTGGSSTLTATGCTGGTITWGDGLGTNNSPTVSPTSTTTYTATCTLNGCTSANGSVVVTVDIPSGGGSYDQCQESETATGNGTVTSDPNASNGQTRGEESNNNHYVEYTMTSVPSAGTYYVKLRYYSSSAPTVAVVINGGSPQTWNLPNSGSWNIVWTEQTLAVSLAAGTNTIRISGTGGGSCRQDKLCVSNTSGGSVAAISARMQEAAPDQAASPIKVYPNPSNGRFEVSFYLEKGKKASLLIVDQLGRVLQQKSITGNGQHREKLSVGKIAAGTVIVQLRTENSLESKQINILR